MENDDQRTVETADAEASGRIVVQDWDVIAGKGVFAVTSISAGEVLGMLQGNIVRRQRLSRAERRRLIGIRIDGRAAHLDLEGRWPEMINHAPPSVCNVEWDADTWRIEAIRDILPGQQLTWDYGPGFWVDELINRDYDTLPTDQREFFDVMHATVHNYSSLIQALQCRRKLSQSMRIAAIALYLAMLVMGGSSATPRFGLEASKNGAANAQLDTNLVLQYLGSNKAFASFIDPGMNRTTAHSSTAAAH